MHQFPYRLTFKIGETTDNREPEDANSKQLGNVDTGSRSFGFYLAFFRIGEIHRDFSVSFIAGFFFGVALGA